REYPVEKTQFLAEKLAKNQQKCRGIFAQQLPEDIILDYPTDVAEKDLFVAEFGAECIGRLQL
ncbi:MAG: hypothetical protein M3R00_06835, partial [Pseudomonadota bacterium]|nr:hypothetical protein [Pseudomonadota bacterium]